MGTTVTVCPWHEEFKALGLEEAGLVYCAHLDNSIARGFNPYLVYEVPQTLHDCPYCVQKVSNLKGLAPGQAEQGGENHHDQRHDELLHEARRIRNKEVGLVKVGVFYSVAANWLPNILKKFHADCPGIEVEVMEGGYADIAKWLDERKLDIGLLSNLTAEGLKKEPLIYVTPPDFIPKNKTYVTIEEMKENELILQKECGDFDALAFLEANDIKINSYYNMYEDQTLLSLVECGLGTAIMPGLATRLSTSNVNRYHIEPEVTRTIVLAVPDESSVSQATKLFRQHILDFVETEESEV